MFLIEQVSTNDNQKIYKITKCLRVIHSFKYGNEVELEQIDSTDTGKNFMAQMYCKKQERTKNNSMRSERGFYKKKKKERTNIIIKNFLLVIFFYVFGKLNRSSGK